MRLLRDFGHRLLHVPFADERVTRCLRTGPIIDLGLSKTKYVHSAGLEDSLVDMVFVSDPLSCAGPTDKTLHRTSRYFSVLKQTSVK